MCESMLSITFHIALSVIRVFYTSYLKHFSVLSVSREQRNILYITDKDKEGSETAAAAECVSEDTPITDEESSETIEQETPEIKLETAPADFRFPTTNQSRHCFTRYIEYHRCIAAKGEGAPEFGKFAKYYRSFCPGEWIDQWNEQRENGTFPGPL